MNKSSGLHLALLTLAILLSGTITAQGDWWFDSEEREREITGVDKRPFSERSFKERLTLGGGAALQLGTNTLIGGAPQVGYRINEDLIAGVGGTYYFQRFKADYGNVDNHLFGANLFARHKLFDRIFAHAEWEQVNVQSAQAFDPNTRTWFSLLWVGGGYYTGLSDRLGAGFTLLYDVSENQGYPYQNPTIRGGVSFGF
jgi:hypothetical protein